MVRGRRGRGSSPVPIVPHPTFVPTTSTATVTINPPWPSHRCFVTANTPLCPPPPLPPVSATVPCLRPTPPPPSPAPARPLHRYMNSCGMYDDFMLDPEGDVEAATAVWEAWFGSPAQEVGPVNDACFQDGGTWGGPPNWTAGLLPPYCNII